MHCNNEVMVVFGFAFLHFIIVVNDYWEIEIMRSFYLAYIVLVCIFLKNIYLKSLVAA